MVNFFEKLSFRWIVGIIDIKFALPHFEYLFGEDQGRYIVEIESNNLKYVTDILDKNSVPNLTLDVAFPYQLNIHIIVSSISFVESSLITDGLPEHMRFNIPYIIATLILTDADKPNRKDINSAANSLTPQPPILTGKVIENSIIGVKTKNEK